MGLFGRRMGLLVTLVTTKEMSSMFVLLYQLDTMCRFLLPAEGDCTIVLLNCPSPV